VTPAKKLRLLLVDDHADTRGVLSRLLTRSGHEVVTAESAQKALEILDDRQFDALISDIGLPDGDGWLLMEKLGDHRPGFAIAMSGYGTRNDRQKSRAAGYDHHLVKPFQPDMLLGLLANVNGLGGIQL